MAGELELRIAGSRFRVADLWAARRLLRRIETAEITAEVWKLKGRKPFARYARVSSESREWRRAR